MAAALHFDDVPDMFLRSLLEKSVVFTPLLGVTIIPLALMGY